jgi:hypothetical protein
LTKPSRVRCGKAFFRSPVFDAHALFDDLQTVEDIDIKQVINAVKLGRKAPLPPRA